VILVQWQGGAEEPAVILDGRSLRDQQWVAAFRVFASIAVKQHC